MPQTPCLRHSPPMVPPHISGNVQRMPGVDALPRVHRSQQLLGTALTVTYQPGDSLYAYKARTARWSGQIL